MGEFRLFNRSNKAEAYQIKSEWNEKVQCTPLLSPAQSANTLTNHTNPSMLNVFSECIRLIFIGYVKR